MTGPRLSAFLNCVIMAACTPGLIFGYEIGISGWLTLLMPNFLKKFFPGVYNNLSTVDDHGTNTDRYCKLDDTRLTLFVSLFYLAASFGTFVASDKTRSFGPKRSMIIGGSISLVGAIVNIRASLLILSRVLIGVGIGFTNQGALVYISETAPYEYGWACNMIFQFTTAMGISLANCVTLIASRLENDGGWRITLGWVPAFLALFVIVTSLGLPDTPNFLVERGKHQEAKTMLIKIRGTQEVDQEFNDIVAANVKSKKILSNPMIQLFKDKYRPHLSLMTLISFSQQFMNVFLFYTPVVFKTIGFDDEHALLYSATSNFVYFMAIVASGLPVERFGKMGLFIVGGMQMFLSQIVIWCALKLGVDGNPGELSLYYVNIVGAAICVYTCAFAFSWGLLGSSLFGEIFPLEMRSTGISTNMWYNMLFSFLVAQIFFSTMCKMKSRMFLYFSFFVFFMTFFIYYLVPETKGVPIKDIQEIWKTHPTWKSYVCDNESGDDENVSTTDYKTTEDINVP